MISFSFIGINTISTLTPKFIASAPASSLNSDLMYPTVHSTLQQDMWNAAVTKHIQNWGPHLPAWSCSFHCFPLISQCNSIFLILYPKALLSSWTLPLISIGKACQLTLQNITRIWTFLTTSFAAPLSKPLSFPAWIVASASWYTSLSLVHFTGWPWWNTNQIV